jgi:hypothetical protein
MDDRTRRDQRTDVNGQKASQPNDVEQREESYRRREQTDERPALTRREREDPWPIG